MRSFVVYTLARLGIFLGVYAVIWLGIGRSVAWDSISGLYTALLALVVSSLIAFVALRGLRGRLADEVAARAEKAWVATGAGGRSGTSSRGGKQETEEHPGAVRELGEAGVAEDGNQP